LEILSSKQKGGLSDTELEQWRNVDTAEEFEDDEGWETLGVEPIPVLDEPPKQEK